MEFKGHVKSSFIDYPDRICTVYFVGGCNFRCPYCHNAPLLEGEGESIDEEQVFEYLEKRKNVLDGVCISGGEPTIRPDLEDFLARVKQRGFLVKLDTNGTNPYVVEGLLKRRAVDYIAMDIKAPFGKYNVVAGKSVDTKAVKKSTALIRNASIEYEFRTTVCRELLSIRDIIEIAHFIKGSQRYAVQNFRDRSTVLAGQGIFTPFATAELDRVRESISGLFKEFIIR
jgi:pyruvate formate lyase activating enzyme